MRFITFPTPTKLGEYVCFTFSSKHHRLIANPSDLSNDQWKNPGWLGVVQGMTSYRSFIGILISRSKNKSKKPVCVPTSTAPPPKTGSRSPEVRLHHRHQWQRGDGGASPMVCVAMFFGVMVCVIFDGWRKKSYIRTVLGFPLGMQTGCCCFGFPIFSKLVLQTVSISYLEPKWPPCFDWMVEVKDGGPTDSS